MERLALLAGNPVRSNPFTRWPAPSDALEKTMAEVAAEGIWSDVAGLRKLAFEQQFAEYVGATHGLAVSNGTVSLQIALGALGVGSGDEVIVPAYTFLATASAVLMVNALPIFVDVDETGCLDPDAVEAAITPRTKALIPVHLAGHPADMDRLCEIAARHGLPIIEDAAHAHGARWGDRRVGSIGEFGSFSFQASKNLSSGEGGALTTNDDALADAAWSLHHCGRPRHGKWYDYDVLGGNYRMTEFQAALLSVQLADLDEQIARRERSAAVLDSGLRDIAGLAPLHRDPRCTTHGYHLYQFWYDPTELGGLTRERFVAALNAEGIPASAGYVVPLYRQPLFAGPNFDVVATGYDPSNPATRYGTLELPMTEKFCRDVIWIPQNVLLSSDEDMAQVLTALAKVSAAAGDLIAHAR
ncbi:MAG: DegT/DnrJ/EryC1/StrS family aminotransferase [Nakamurella sp.]